MTIVATNLVGALNRRGLLGPTLRDKLCAHLPGKREVIERIWEADEWSPAADDDMEMLLTRLVLSADGEVEHVAASQLAEQLMSHAATTVKVGQLERIKEVAERRAAAARKLARAEAEQEETAKRLGETASLLDRETARLADLRARVRKAAVVGAVVVLGLVAAAWRIRAVDQAEAKGAADKALAAASAEWVSKYEGSQLALGAAKSGLAECRSSDGRLREVMDSATRAQAALHYECLGILDLESCQTPRAKRDFITEFDDAQKVLRKAICEHVEGGKAECDD